MSDVRCRECGKPVEDHFVTSEQLKADRLCFSCDFWMEKVRWAEAGDPKAVRIDGQHFYMSDPTGGMRGYGGREFVFEFFDGRVVSWKNVWHQGVIPEHFRDRLPDNARHRPASNATASENSNAIQENRT